MSASPQAGFTRTRSPHRMNLRNANAPCAPRLSLLPFAQGGERWEELVKQAPGSSVYHGPQWRRTLNRPTDCSFRVALLEEDGGRSPDVSWRELATPSRAA